MVNIFERFTDRARRVIVLAMEEARSLNHGYIGSEHILLGLLHEGEGIGAKALTNLGIDLNDSRNQILELVDKGTKPFSGHIPYTPRAKKILELSLREALQLGHNYIGTEHILLGLVREATSADGNGIAAKVFEDSKLDLARIRQEVIQILSGYNVRKKQDEQDKLKIQFADLLDQMGMTLTGFQLEEAFEKFKHFQDPPDVTEDPSREELREILEKGIPASIMRSSLLFSCIQQLEQVGPRERQAALAYLNSWYGFNS